MDLLSPPTSLSPHSSGGEYFTPNPRANLTLSQLTFRNTLMVDGQRDVAYKDIDDHLRWASEEGEQAQLPELQPPTVEVTEVEATDADEYEIIKKKEKRPPGKLYGRSLIDDLEARKIEMKSKQRCVNSQPSGLVSAAAKFRILTILSQRVHGRSTTLNDGADYHETFQHTY